LIVEAAHWAAPVTVYDSALRPVATGVDRLDLKVPAGLYKVETRLAGAVASRVIDLLQGQPLQVARADWDLRFPSPAPLRGTSTTREYYRENARSLSTQPPWTEPNAVTPGDLFVFVRLQDRELVSRYPDFEKGLRLSNSEGDPIPALGTHGTRHDVEGWFGCSLRLEAGAYVLSVGEGAPDARSQPVWVEPGFQTQVFIPAASHPLIERLTISMAAIGDGFDAYDDAGTAAELILDGLQRGINLATSDQIKDLVRGKLKNPWLAILAAHALELDAEPDPLFVDLVRSFLDSAAHNAKIAAAFDGAKITREK